MQGQALPGFRDFYPDELALRNHIFATWREVARRYGFQEYDGPPLEPLELYTDKSGEEIVQQLYAFDDKGGRKVALRPEMTPTLARMVGAHAQALKKPIRWFSIPQLFRYERQQRGRLREHFQLNMDILGEASPLADSELIAAAIDIMRAFGLGPRDVQAANLREAGVGKRETDAVFEIAALRGLDALLSALGKVKGGEEAGEPLRQAVGALQAMGLGDFVAVDLTIVRGLAYYTGIVFELFDTGKSLRAVCGGGRYDGLLRALGGLDLPALGFGMGDVVLGELLKERRPADQASTKLDAFLIAVSGDDVAPLLKLAHQLRDLGVAVEYGLRPAAIRKQLELAAARGAPRAIIVGPDERAAGEVVVRDLKAGTEERVPIAKLVQGSFH